MDKNAIFIRHLSSTPRSDRSISRCRAAIAHLFWLHPGQLCGGRFRYASGNPDAAVRLDERRIGNDKDVAGFMDWYSIGWRGRYAYPLPHLERGRYRLPCPRYMRIECCRDDCQRHDNKRANSIGDKFHRNCRKHISKHGKRTRHRNAGLRGLPWIE